MNERWRITVVPPDWGQTHLTPEAVVAYVDDELAQRPHLRAGAHLAACPECAAQVTAQRQARSTLRAAAGPCLPSSLLDSLRSIPQLADPPPPGYGRTADGELVAVLRPAAFGEPVGCPVAHEPPAGLGAVTDVVAPRHGMGHRVRVGAGVAVSGIALGALAFGVPASGPTTIPTQDRGLLGGPVLGGGAVPVAEFRTRVTPAGRSITDPTTGRTPADDPPR